MASVQGFDNLSVPFVLLWPVVAFHIVLVADLLLWINYNAKPRINEPLDYQYITPNVW